MKERETDKKRGKVLTNHKDKEEGIINRKQSKEKQIGNSSERTERQSRVQKGRGNRGGEKSQESKESVGDASVGSEE